MKKVNMVKLLLGFHQRVKRFIQAEEFDVIYGGGEANVAVHSLTMVMMRILSKLPDNPIGTIGCIEIN